LKKKNADFF